MLVVIPARGGSKGIPNKNIKKLNGKPLIQYTIEAARKVFEDNQIIVSTDSEEIRQAVIKLGLEVPFLRPAKLALDDVGTHEVLLHAMEFIEKNGTNLETVVLLQPTSPFRNSNHLGEAMKKYDSNLDMLVSVKETAANPYFVLREENEDGFLVSSKKSNFVRRQDCPKVWELNGAIYIINANSLRRQTLTEFTKVKKFEMDEISSHDIDTKLDWLIAESILKTHSI